MHEVTPIVIQYIILSNFWGAVQPAPLFLWRCNDYHDMAAVPPAPAHGCFFYRVGISKPSSARFRKAWKGCIR